MKKNMHDIIEHYGKVALALFGVAVLIGLGVIIGKIVSQKTQDKVNNMEYDVKVDEVLKPSETPGP